MGEGLKAPPATTRGGGRVPFFAFSKFLSPHLVGAPFPRVTHVKPMNGFHCGPIFYQVYSLSGGTLPIIGVGGVDSAENA